MVLLGIHFPTFNKTRAYLEASDAPGTFSPWKILASGAAAGAAGSFVSSPTELIRTKMQMVRKNNLMAEIKGAAAGGLSPEENYKGNWDCAKKIFRNHGMRGMYSGYLSTLARDMQVCPRGVRGGCLSPPSAMHACDEPCSTGARLMR
jgi:hypothetical protein